MWRQCGRNNSGFPILRRNSIILPATPNGEFVFTLMNADSPSPDSASVPRRLRERQRKIGELLEAAGEIFARKGFHQTSMEDIASAAEYATGSLYRYFPSKEALYIGLLEKRYGELIARVKSIVASTNDPVEALRAVISAQVDLMRRDLSILQIFFSEGLEEASRSERWTRMESWRQDFYDWLAARVAKGQAAGVFLQGDPKLYVMALQGMLSALLRHWVNGSEDTADSDQQKNFLIELSLRAICVNPPQNS